VAVCVTVMAFGQRPSAEPPHAAPALNDPRALMEESLRRQRESVEMQRVSVRKQAQTATRTAPSNAFFTAPWVSPPETTPPADPAPPAVECDPPPKEKIGEIVSEISKREGLTPNLLHAVIEQESSYLPCAVSPKGAQGLMQLMPGTAAELGIADPFDPRENVGGGARYLKQLLVKYEGNLPLALAAYNAGPGRVDAARSIPAIPETMNYVEQILNRMRPR